MRLAAIICAVALMTAGASSGASSQDVKFDPVGKSICVPTHGSLFKPGPTPEAYILGPNDDGERLRGVEVEIHKLPDGHYAGKLTARPATYTAVAELLPADTPHVFEFRHLGMFNIRTDGSAVWWWMSRFASGEDQWIVFYLECSKVS